MKIHCSIRNEKSEVLLNSDYETLSDMTNELKTYLGYLGGLGGPLEAVRVHVSVRLGKA